MYSLAKVIKRWYHRSEVFLFYRISTERSMSLVRTGCDCDEKRFRGTWVRVDRVNLLFARNITPFTMNCADVDVGFVNDAFAISGKQRTPK